MRSSIWLPSWIFVLILPSGAWAHALGADANIKGNQVVVETYFHDNTPARSALVKVLDGQEKILQQGKTDDKGIFAFPLPAAGQYQVIVIAEGHRTQVTVKVPEQTISSNSSPAPSAPENINPGTPRAEFTRYPWLGVTVGLVIIALFTLPYWLARRRHTGTQ